MEMSDLMLKYLPAMWQFALTILRNAGAMSLEDEFPTEEEGGGGDAGAGAQEAHHMSKEEVVKAWTDVLDAFCAQVTPLLAAPSTAATNTHGQMGGRAFLKSGPAAQTTMYSGRFSSKQGTEAEEVLQQLRERVELDDSWLDMLNSVAFQNQWGVHEKVRKGQSPRINKTSTEKIQSV